MKMSRAGVEYHLKNWGDWKRTGGLPGKVETTSAFSGAHNAACEEGTQILYEACERESAEIMDVIISGLVPAHQCIITNKWLHHVYYVRDPENTYNEAIKALAEPCGRRLVYVLDKCMPDKSNILITTFQIH